MKRILIGLLCLIISYPLFASLKKSVDKIIEQVDPAINIGVAVYDLTSGETLYQRNPHRAFIPASNMKLFSDAAALMILGPDYRFKTQLSTNASRIEEGALKGYLYLDLPGDPSLTQTNLAELFAQLKSWGVNKIQGNIVLVSTNRYVNASAPGWMAEDLRYSYGAPLAPLILDENRLRVTVNPGHKTGAPALIELSDKNGGFLIENRVKTKAQGANCGIDFQMTADNRLRLNGCVGLGQWAVQQGLSIRNPLRYAQHIIAKKLRDLNIALEGKIILGNRSGPSLLLASHYSKPISQLMADTLKPSDNLYADSLFLHAAAQLKRTPLNWQQTQSALKEFLQTETGINLQSAVLTDGSGLSRYDQLTPAQTVNLLRFLHDRFPMAYEFIAALPVAGFDGTLQKRFRKPNQQGFVRAKTGTMTGVVSLSGFLYTANAHTLAFAIYINGLPGTSPKISGRYRYLVDALCGHFLQQKPRYHLISRVKNAHARIAYQQKPPQTQLQRSKKAHWRRLESSIKQKLKGQSVAVLYRGDELEIQDYNQDVQRVWRALKDLRTKHNFSVALMSNAAPQSLRVSPYLMWIKQSIRPADYVRTWRIRESIV